MFGPSKIMKWLDRNLQDVRRSRRKALAHIAAGAMKMKGVGVLALGRAMDGPAIAKHRIKRVDRFLANEQLESLAISKTLFNILRGEDQHPFVLVDWTDRHAFEQLVLSIPRDGRSMPFHAITINSTKLGTESKGTLIQAEQEILRQLHAMCPPGVKPVIVADRGFGNERWISDVTKWGWRFVQRISKNHYVETEHHIGTIPELGIRRGYRPKDWGWGTMGEDQDENKTRLRLVTVFHRDADEPWYLITNIEDAEAKKIVAIYQKRWWTETMFRDLKNRKWGLGMDEVKLTSLQRTATHFIIVIVAYILLCAFGAFAETKNFGEQLKANTAKNRALSLAATGNLFIEFIGRTTVAMAILKLVRTPT
ncbi:MAG: IS4 family transposase [bacterium]|nr:IS4 family transposase [bacterium]